MASSCLDAMPGSHAMDAILLRDLSSWFNVTLKHRMLRTFRLEAVSFHAV